SISISESSELLENDSTSEIPDKLLYEGDNSHITWKASDLHETLFPHSLSTVCTAWRELMSKIPIFWTRLVIFVGGQHETLLSDVRLYLEWSQEFYITVHVTRSLFEVPEQLYVHDAHEYAHSRGLIDILAPHFHRMKALSFSLHQSSSLPRLFDDLQGPALHLESLILECKYDDGRNEDELTPEDLPPILLPRLRQLSIDGRSLLRIYDTASWLFDISSKEMIGLEISRFTPSHDGRSIDLHDFLGSISGAELDIVRIRDVSFTWRHYPIERIPLFCYWHFSDVYFEDLGPGVIGEFIRAIGSLILRHVHITRCPLAASAKALPAGELVIEDIGDPAGLVAFIRNWRGEVLTLTKCPTGVVDAVLGVMAIIQGDPINPDLFFVPCVRDLCLRDCEDFEFWKLRELYDLRTNLGPSTLRIRMDGRSPVLSVEDAEWVDQNATLFL
ncbi:hypothetical protein H0H81_003552, partial [Sphagnurus paluster]